MSRWIPGLCRPHEWIQNHLEPVHVVTGPLVQVSQRNASICRQYLPSIILNPENVEESSEQVQTDAQPSMVGV